MLSEYSPHLRPPALAVLRGQTIHCTYFDEKEEIIMSLLVDAYGNPIESTKPEQDAKALLKKLAKVVRSGVPITAITEDTELRKLLHTYLIEDANRWRKEQASAAQNKVLRQHMSKRAIRKWKKSNA